MGDPLTAGQPPRRRTSPLWPTSRAGRPSLVSQDTARQPATIAAVAAAFASAQVAAATLTVRHGPSAGRPVHGSTM